MEQSNISERKKRTSALDVAIGIKIKMKRIDQNMLQHELASRLGLTFQQLQKYEKGKNRVSAVTLYKISKILDCPIEYFYEGLDDNSFSLCDNSENAYIVEHNQEEADALLKGYFKLKNKGTRKRFLSFLKACENE